jgi:hypothetical protein
MAVILTQLLDDMDDNSLMASVLNILSHNRNLGARLPKAATTTATTDTTSPTTNATTTTTSPSQSSTAVPANVEANVTSTPPTPTPASAAASQKQPEASQDEKQMEQLDVAETTTESKAATEELPVAPPQVANWFIV